MKRFRACLAILVGLGASVGAQEPASASSPVEALGPQRSPEELEQLLAPVALYPDALLAIVLPATTAPTDIVLAARYLRDNPGDRSQVENRAWDESVKSLTSYPEVVLWLDDNLPWTQQVGDAFARQSGDVMQAVQRLRAKARAAGTLIDTPQQQVIAEPEIIRIVPSQPDIIYVPHYEPDIVFVDRPVYYSRPFITFGIGVPVGSWLAFDCDWRRRTIWVGDRHRRWQGHDWHRPVVPIAPAYRSAPIAEVRQWRPPPPSVRPHVIASNRFRSEVVRPNPIPVNTARNYGPRPGYSDRTRTFDAAPGPSSLPTPAPANPGSFRGRHEYAGPRVQNVPNTPPPATAAPTPNSAPPTAMPNLQPLPQARRPDRTPSNDQDNNVNNSWRGRGSRNAGPSSAPSAIVGPTVPNQPAPPPSAPAFNRGNGNGGPRFSPPSTPRSESSAPRVAPAPPPAPATNTTPASPPPQGGESRGHRGNYRRDDR